MIEHEAWRLIGQPRFGGILVVSDHASNRVPADIDLGIDPALLTQHIAIDLGVAEVGAIMAARVGTGAFQGHVSRLVCDFNRAVDAPGVVPIASDGHAIPGNALDHAHHLARLERFYHPYHTALADLLSAKPPALVLSLHSFTPQLASHPDELRPWQCGVLYNQDDRAARLAIPWLQAAGLTVGDQQPYSGTILNETMNRHCEADGRPYLGIEVRQDQIADPAGQQRWAAMLASLCKEVALKLAE